jgi:hypothetical protein
MGRSPAANGQLPSFHQPGLVSVLKSLQDIPLGDVMKRIAAFLLVAAFSVAWSLPATAQRENRSIGENSVEAKRAAKQYQKASKKTAKKQQKMMKKYQKAQRKAAKRQQRRH